VIRQLILPLVALIAVPYVLNQVRRPTKWVGRVFLWSMNRSHSGVTDWGLTHAPIAPEFSILDVGCGGGRTIQKLAVAATAGRVAGVDYSVGSVNAARALNAASIRAGRVEIVQASVSHLPYPDTSFDLVTAVETHYYWPDLPGDLQEVLRVVKPGGTAVVIAEAYRGSGHDRAQRPVMKLLGATLMSGDEHREWFASAGFADVQLFEERSRGWMCVTGRKPR
jgi:ubiquinone/menaquinone biosynthesis C-methylase UbiE